MAPTYFCVAETGEELGPFTASEVANHVRSNQFTKDTLTRSSDGGMKFKKLNTFRQITEALAEEPPPQPASSSSAPAEITTEKSGWYYTDDGGCERGPLRTLQMRKLIEDGFLHGPRDVRRGTEIRDISLWPELDLDAADPIEQDDEFELEGDDTEWVFIDDDGEMQGPFATAEMRAWVESGDLEPSRKVNIAGGEPDEFRPLSEWAELMPSAAGEEGEEAEDEAAAIDARLAMLRGGTTTAPAEEAAAAQPPPAAPLKTTGWMYLDDAGIEQGPFTTKKIANWVKRGIFTKDRLVRPPPSDDGNGVEAELQPIANFPQLVGEETSAAAAPPPAEACTSSSNSIFQPGQKEVVDAAVAVPAAPPSSSNVFHDSNITARAAFDDTLFEYYDDHGKPQGPFTAKKLMGWLKGGHLKPTRMARQYTPGQQNEGRSGFTPLNEIQYFAEKLNDGALPKAPPKPQDLGGSSGGMVEVPTWYYDDAVGKEQGPFTSTQMMAWFAHQQLHGNTMVRHMSEGAERKRPLIQVPQIVGVAAMQHQAQAGGSGSSSAAGAAGEQEELDPAAAMAVARGLAPTATLQYEQHRVLGGFSRVGNNRFLNPDESGDKYFEKKAIPKHRDERQMNNYFDLGAWQDEQNARRQAGKGVIGVKKRRVV